MKPVDFDYVKPSDLNEVLQTLNLLKDKAKILSGGQSLLPVLNMRLARPEVVVDINEVKELNHLVVENDYIKMGAGVRHSFAEQSAIMKDYLPLLAKCIPYIGHSQIRNRGTVIGSIVHADPSAEIPLVALILDGHLELVSEEDKRTVPLSEFFYGYMMTDLQPEEMVTSLNIPVRSIPVGGSRGTSFIEMARREGDFALVAAAAQLEIDKEGFIYDVRIGLGGVGPAPIRLEEVENFLQQKEPTEDLFIEASQLIKNYLEVDEDPFVPKEYREHVAFRFVQRVLSEALADAKTSYERMS
ncbi:xanthine dehydrogenase family protein subunit M [Alteribacillus sp. YIM 98480]|uniref:FAD binding domain-containing protein n=1 Tax=Alteribacillus sp. YIM 98480 TaxID=2606599 RepID=UPI00131BCDFF|nr:FAD binding domain-containing protein [Alteribacillus sp. YIM 98480]